jgi:hypothetical protein
MPKKFRGSALKRKWVEALRSGEYEQGQGKLRKVENGRTYHCCLGVLCEVAEIPHIKMHMDEGVAIHGYVFRGVTSRSTATLPYNFVNQHFSSENDPWKLIELNDAGKSFEEIADYIESKVRMKEPA